MVGRAFCGVVGSIERREYTVWPHDAALNFGLILFQVMGDMVNLSARLMAAAGDNTVYVDEATYNASNKGLDFEV